MAALQTENARAAFGKDAELASATAALGELREEADEREEAHAQEVAALRAELAAERAAANETVVAKGRAVLNNIANKLGAHRLGMQ